MHSVERFYRVHFANAQVLREWSLRVLEIAASRDDVPMWAVPRTVVFVPLEAPAEGPTFGYVSESARSMASSATKDITLDRSPVSMRELPDGLGVLVGDASDTKAYEQRGSSAE